MVFFDIITYFLDSNIEEELAEIERFKEFERMKGKDNNFEVLKTDIPDVNDLSHIFNRTNNRKWKQFRNG